MIEIVRFKDRFTIPSAGGWRDLMVNIVVLDSSGAGSAARHVCELQVAHEMMLTARKGLPGVRPAAATLPSPHCCERAPFLPVLTCAALCSCRDAQHEIYAIVRNAMEIIESCGLERELRREAVRKLRAEGSSEAEVVAAFEDGWLVSDAAWARCAGDATQLARRVKADEEGRVVEMDFKRCSGTTELPASVGRLQVLQTPATLHRLPALQAAAMSRRLQALQAAATL